MNRREALKKLGLSFGFLVGAPTAVSILQGCSTSTTSTGWKPQFFSLDEAEVITKVVDIILPATESSPSASEVNVPQFIDQYLQEVVSLEEQDLTKKYFSNYIDKLKRDSGKNDVTSLIVEDIEPSIAQSLDKTPEEEQEIHSKINSYVQATQEGEQTELYPEVASYALLTNIRSLAIWSYKTSETVGEEILAYEPNPGRQEGCIDVEDATGGVAWSL